MGISPILKMQNGGCDYISGNVRAQMDFLRSVILFRSIILHESWFLPTYIIACHTQWKPNIYLDEAI